MKINKKITVLIILSFLLSIGSIINSYSILSRDNGIVEISKDKYNVEYTLNNYITSNENISFNESPIIKDNELKFTLGLSNINSYGQIYLDINNTGNYDSIFKDIEIQGLDEYKDYINIELIGIQKDEIIKKGITKKNISIKITYTNIYETETIDLNNIKIIFKTEKVGD